MIFASHLPRRVASARRRRVARCRSRRASGRGTVRRTRSGSGGGRRRAAGRAGTDGWRCVRCPRGRIATPRRAAASVTMPPSHHQHFLVGERDRSCRARSRRAPLRAHRCLLGRTAAPDRRRGEVDGDERPSRSGAADLDAAADAVQLQPIGCAPPVAIAATQRPIARRSASASSSAFSPRREADDHLQPVGMRVDDRERAAGRSIRSIRGWRCASRRKARVFEDDVVDRRSEQRRCRSGSSTPPWPGISVELSFTPALRFSIDSNRSPAMPARPATPTRDRGTQRRRRPGSHHAPSDGEISAAARSRRRRPRSSSCGLIAGASGRARTRGRCNTAPCR